ncbi:hypothetical protein [Goekera deserti]|uniref:Uncharacterized protein n=1 Tax=Goekera deserti TaxID=2497753 RepID=A0A7K3WDZ1_9ACTN|nr:hypothetical protein [Goekera deserti]NDI47995.1 hypothetical protein [Goekera deserti]NEL53743.1 hypothetical protein [Goekera deserti]
MRAGARPAEPATVVAARQLAEEARADRWRQGQGAVPRRRAGARRASG